MHATRSTPALVAGLAAHGERVALVGEHGSLTYADLADGVAATAERLGPTRRLVLIEGGHTVEAITAHLGALAGGHVVLLSGDAAVDSLALAYRPDVVIAEEFTEVREGTAHDLHPDLALLLSTSGSTGSPKLVRLSHDNLLANARAIADYLALTPDDLAATTLPMHYCYGLSVLHSHLVAGAGLLLTERSVLELEFWDEFRASGATSFAGVPHTFELLDRVGFAELDLPTLRYVTQAGGKLAPADVRRHAELGVRRGYDLFVMYGQTEATARMAYLPPALALTSPEAIGVPIPGGGFHLEPLPERPLTRAAEDTVAVGELVYDGPNVMLGYAESPADLARGREVEHLRTGDVARLRTDGLYEVIGRRSRITKVFGLRIDLDHVERVLAQQGVIVAAADGGDHLILAVCDGARPVRVDDVQALVKRQFNLPPAGVHVSTWAEIPLLPTGKTDYRRLVEADGDLPLVTSGAAAADVQDLYAALLGRRSVSLTDSFVGLGGDSLSYVEASLRLERMLGHLPAQWHTLPIGALVDAPREPARRGRQVETNVLLRALGIVTIVATHTGLISLMGGAHVMLAVVGYNLARFQLGGSPRAERVRSIVRGTARVALPSMALIALVSLYRPQLGLPQILLSNNLVTLHWEEPAWHYWFIEAIVQTLLFVALLMAIPAVDRFERRRPFLFPMLLATAGLVFVYKLAHVPGQVDPQRSYACFYLFALGWAAARTSSTRQRLIISAFTIATVPGFVPGVPRTAYIMLGILALIWIRQVRVPAWVAQLAGLLAGASLWIYLVHWEVFPAIQGSSRLLATIAGLAAGIVVHQVLSRVPRLLGNGTRRLDG
jgi:non-ribosomal peptide synthetase component E (peptide arylation enzyme)/surface polysaccharide O-acyltransferase-like enzyme